MDASSFPNEVEMAFLILMVFFVSLCADGKRIKVCEVLNLDTEPARVERSKNPENLLSIRTGLKSSTATSRWQNRKPA